MTYIDLLQYILSVQNVEKKELARFIGTNPKKLDKILSGEKQLSKKNLKFLSAFTGIPAESIKNGMFSLAAPVEKNENEEGQTTEIDPYIEEYNRSKLFSFLKVRHKVDVVGFKIINVVCLILAVFALIVSTVCFVAFCYGKPGVRIGMFSVSFILPVLLSLVSLFPINKIRSKANYSEIKTYKIYSIFIILAIMIFNGTTLYYDINSLPAFLVLTAGSVMTFIDVVLRKPYSKKVFSEYFFTILTMAVMIVGYYLFANVDTTQLIEENERMQFYGVAAFWTSYALMIIHIALECGTGLIRTTYPAYRHFIKSEQKSILKKNSVLKSAIAVIIAFGIFCGATFAFSIYVRKQTLDELRALLPENTYKDYDKSDIVFSDKEETIVVDYGNYTIELPAAFKEKEPEKDSTLTTKTYNEKNKEAGVFLREYMNIIPKEGFGLSEDRDEKEKEAALKIQEGIKEKYGFYPKSLVEWKELEQKVRENKEFNYFSRDDMAVEMFLASFLSVAEPSGTTVMLGEDNEKEFSIQESKVGEGDKERTIYIIQGNMVGDYNNGIDIMGFVEDDYSDPNVMYKIINSIKFK